MEEDGSDSDNSNDGHGHPNENRYVDKYSYPESDQDYSNEIFVNRKGIKGIGAQWAKWIRADIVKYKNVPAPLWNLLAYRKREGL